MGDVIPFPGTHTEPGMYSVVECTPRGNYLRLHMGEGWMSFRSAFGFYKLMKRRQPKKYFVIIPGPGNKHYRTPSGDDKCPA